MSSTTTVPLVKPKLRGVFHYWAFLVFAGLGALLVIDVWQSEKFLPVFIYALSVTALFGISALYHRPHWGLRSRLWLKRLDHSAIFIFMAGTAAPICLIGMHEYKGPRLMMIVGFIALLGILRALFFVKAKKWLSALIPISVTFFILPYVPEMYQALGFQGIFLMCLGGFFYAIGGLIYAGKKPNPWPRVFGYHEIFHILVIFAALSHYAVIAAIVH